MTQSNNIFFPQAWVRGLKQKGKQSLEESKDGNSFDTKESKKNKWQVESHNDPTEMNRYQYDDGMPVWYGFGGLGFEYFKKVESK